MFAFFKRPGFLAVVGFVLVALFIWIAGPYFAFAGYQPLVPAPVRLVLIAFVVSGWSVWQMLKARRATQASDKLMAAVVKQPDAPVVNQADGASGRPSAEAVQLREKFEEALGVLKRQRRRGHSLYDLPWYVIIGAPGSGKTTALIHSGLHFPAEQRSALRGVGGTRNCDWWFTDEAILLDTAGRYTTQDSDSVADSSAWAEFLALLKKYRKRRPINGVILTISAHDLLTQGRRERETHIESARRRLDELNRELRIQLPVYVMVTKSDLVAGFTEYFDDLESKESRAQVWGVTFPYERTVSGEAAQMFSGEFDALMARLNERVLARLNEERVIARRARVFGFPQQMSALRESVSEFVAGVFSSTKFERQVLLRGVYFTSGTQEGTPIDRLMAGMAARMSVAPEALAGSAGRGKAYFIESLLKDVMIAESGLAGINRRFEVQKAAAQLSVYAALAVVGILGFLALVWSYAANRAYVAQVFADVQRLPPASLSSVSPGVLVPRLDALRGVVDSAGRYQGNVPLRMRWGLYQGNSLSNTARDAYVRELGVTLLPSVAARIERRLIDYGTQPEKLYEYLKAYLMLSEPAVKPAPGQIRFDAAHVGALADLEWASEYATQPDTASALSRHFRTLLQEPDSIPPSRRDSNLVERAQSTIRRASIPHLIYSRLKLNHSDDVEHAVRLDVAAGLGAEQVFRRKSGIPLSAPVPALYTVEVFQQVIKGGIEEVARQFADEQWVWGEGSQVSLASGTLSRDVTNLYEDDYISVWDGVLNDIELVSASGATGTAQLLGHLGGRNSPLRGLLQTVDTNTYLARPAEPPKQEDRPSGAAKTASATLKKLLGTAPAAAAAPQGDPPGTRVTKHFEPIHQMVTGPPGSAPIDRVLELMGRLEQQLGGLGSDKVGGTDPTSNPAAINPMLDSLQAEARGLPPVVSSIVRDVHDRSAAVTRAGIRSGLEGRYQQEVAMACREVVNGNYPFVRGSATDAPPADVARLFGDGGVFDSFFKANLQPLVDTSRPGWKWKVDASGAPVGSSASMLRQFEAARRIRDILFVGGPQAPSLQFTLTPSYLDEKALRFVLDVDGQVIEYRHGPAIAKRIAWPGQNPGSASFAFEDGTAIRPNKEFKGEWAWFRLLDSAVVREETVTRHTITFQLGGHEARVVLDAQSVRNPFASRELQEFRCEI